MQVARGEQSVDLEQACETALLKQATGAEHNVPAANGVSLTLRPSHRDQAALSSSRAARTRLLVLVLHVQNSRAFPDSHSTCNRAHAQARHQP